MSYKEVRFTSGSQEIREIIIAQLSELQYEGFEETDDGIRAYIPEQQFDEEEVKLLAAQLGIAYSITFIPDTNWNQLWESNFQPVVVSNFCGIRAHFHEALQDVQHEIIITPKMSFGTGHHPTTYMMIQQMQEIDFRERSVLDFGTGTGVLAILAHKLGAARIVAIDNDEWSISNARENFDRNGTSSVETILADTPGTSGTYDIILANIIKNVILENFDAFSQRLNPGGMLVLSGLLPEDETSIMAKAGLPGFALVKKLQRENWISLSFSLRG